MAELNRSWQQLNNLVRAARPPRDGDTFDVIVVGAGLSGLAAAYELRAHKPLVLERENRIGGRILTRTQHGVTYDLGAVFALNTGVLPFALPQMELFVESSAVAVAIDNELHSGLDVLECCARLGLDAAEWTALARFVANPDADAASLPPYVYDTLNAFFQVVFPGELRAYARLFQHHALHTFSPQHLTRGNQIVLSELERQIALGPRLRLGATVEQIVDEGAQVRVTYREGDGTTTVTARAVIVTAPAPLARTLVAPLAQETRDALDAVRYASGIVVAVCVRGAQLTDVGCVVTPHAQTTTIFIQHTTERQTSLLLVYYAGGKAQPVWDLDDATLAANTLTALKHSGLGDWDNSEILFTDVQRWHNLGPVMDANAVRVWRERGVALTPRVLLGGELAAMVNADTLPNGTMTMPYGMQAAYVGGQRAAGAVRRLFAQDHRTKQFGSQYLVDATIYHFTTDQPHYVERRSEGNIALYGLVLQATRDEALKNYLLGAAQDGLWEYQDGFGVTAEDSALVLEGLLAYGIPPERLRTSATALVKRFFNRDADAFETVHGGRANYWHGPSIDATAHIGSLLHRIDPQTFVSEICACANFTAAQQQPDGLWQGRWFPSQCITTFYAVRLLSEPEYDAVVQRAHAALLERQKRNGSWADSVIETSAALCALKTYSAPTSKMVQAMLSARAWLLSKRVQGVWHGEPVLYYWYESDDGTKLFYHCQDKGQVTSAWATLALQD